MKKYEHAIFVKNYKVDNHMGIEEDTIFPITIWYPSHNILDWFQTHAFAETHQSMNRDVVLREVEQKQLMTYKGYLEKGKFVGIRLDDEATRTYISLAPPLNKDGWYTDLNQLLTYLNYPYSVSTKKDLLNAKAFLLSHQDELEKYPQKQKPQMKVKK